MTSLRALAQTWIKQAGAYRTSNAMMAIPLPEDVPIAAAAAVKACASELEPHIAAQEADEALIRRMMNEIELLRGPEVMHPQGNCRTCDVIYDARSRLAALPGGKPE